MTDITLENVIRPCVVTHKVNKKLVHKKAIFHRWTTNIVINSGSQIVTALAIVEYEDGTAAQVSVKNLRFLDSDERFSRFADYFSEEEDEKNIEEPVQV